MRRSLILPLLLAGVLLPRLGAAQTYHITQCLGGCPTGGPRGNELIVRHVYAVSVNPGTGSADWVAYRILRGTVGVASLLPRAWQEDDLASETARAAAAPAQTVQLTQPQAANQLEQAYRLTEVQVDPGDQGHLIPLSGFAGTGYWPELNLLSVRGVLASAMRQGPWARLDQSINALAQDLGEVAVFAGPVYTRGDRRQRPWAVFKVVATRDGRVSAFLFPQDLTPHVSHCGQLTSLAQVSRLSGWQFFPQQPDWPTGTLNVELECPEE